MMNERIQNIEREIAKLHRNEMRTHPRNDPYSTNVLCCCPVCKGIRERESGKRKETMMSDAPEGFKRNGDIVEVPREVELAFILGDLSRVCHWVRWKIDPEAYPFGGVSDENSLLMDIEMHVLRWAEAQARMAEYQHACYKRDHPESPSMDEDVE